MYERQELEHELVGALLRGEALGHDTMEAFDLQPGELRTASLRAVYVAMQEAHRAGEPVDPVTVAARVPGGQTGELARLVDQLSDGVLVADRSVAGWIVELREQESRQRWTAAWAQAQRMVTAGETVAAAKAYLEQVEGTDDAQVRGAVDAKGVMTKAYDLIQRAQTESLWVPPGLQALEPYAPLPGDLVVIGARPSVGKTALGLSIQLGMARGDRGCLFASAEMRLEQIGVRELGSLAKIDTNTLLRGGQLSAAGWDRLASVTQDLTHKPLWYTDATQLERICSIAAQLRRRDGCQAAVIDYLQLLDLPDGDTREQEVAQAAKRLKRLATRTGLVIYALAQLRRPGERDVGKPPRLHHLRESGALEQDADSVWLLWRPGQEDEDQRDDRLGVIVGKNRNGPAGTHVWLQFDAGHVRDEDPGRYP